MKDVLLGKKCDHRTENNTYYPLTTCPICKGTGYYWKDYENDIQFDSLGQPVFVEETSKMKQGLLKILMTYKGQDLDPNYGTLIMDELGKKFSLLQIGRIRTEVLSGMAYYNSLEIDNADPKEVISTVDQVQIIRDVEDPRIISASITFKDGEGTQIRLTAEFLKET